MSAWFIFLSIVIQVLPGPFTPSCALPRSRNQTPDSDLNLNLNSNSTVDLNVTTLVQPEAASETSFQLLHGSSRLVLTPGQSHPLELHDLIGNNGTAIIVNETGAGIRHQFDTQLDQLLDILANHSQELAMGEETIFSDSPTQNQSQNQSKGQSQSTTEIQEEDELELELEDDVDGQVDEEEAESEVDSEDEEDEENLPKSSKTEDDEQEKMELEFFSQNGALLINDYNQICGRRFLPRKRTARIVGGQNATFGKWPWQGSLMIWRKVKFYHACGVTLLNQNWAVTAAHCLKTLLPTDLLLRFGQFDFSETSEPTTLNLSSSSNSSSTRPPVNYIERHIQLIARHPQYDAQANTFEYDIALLKFTKPVVFAPNIVPVCLPTDDDKLVGTVAVVTGWGRLDQDAQFLPLPSKLQEVAVPIVANDDCDSMYRKAGFIDETFPEIFICAGYQEGGRDACDGDSGGPLVTPDKEEDDRWVLAGIVSFGIGCAEKNQPGLYTRVSKFRHWIKEILDY